MSEKFDTGRLQGDPIKVHIDLKWSAWSADTSVWEDYAPQTLAHIRDGIEGGVFEESGDTLEIISSPKKECRSMIVAMRPHEGDLVVSVQTATFWDDPNDLADTLGLRFNPITADWDPDEYACLVESLPFAGFSGEIGHEVQRSLVFSLETVTVEELLAAIDAVEDTLITEDEILWKELTEAYQFQAQNSQSARSEP